MTKITENTVDEILNKQVDGGFVLDHRLGNVIKLNGTSFTTNYSYVDLTKKQVTEYVAKVKAYNAPPKTAKQLAKEAKEAEA